MENNNLLSGGVEELNVIKGDLLELRGSWTNKEALQVKEDKLESNISSLEKEISEKIQATTKKRRDEIAGTFDKQIENTQARIKKIKEKRNVKKSSKVSERIVEETAELHGENNQLKLEAKNVLKQKRIPSFVNTKLYYSLYSPSCFTDFLIGFIVLLITLVLIPCAVYFLILPEENSINLVIVYAITVLFFGGFHLLIGNRTKGKHPVEVQKVKGIRNLIRVNKKKIAVIKRNVRKDRDESTYDLKSYDDELTTLDNEVSDILRKKKEALSTFDITTKQVIASEIQSANEDKMTALRLEYNNVVTEMKEAEVKIKALTMKIATEYEPLIGKDLLSIERIESLTNIIQAGTAQNISEAIAFYRQSMNKVTKE